MPVTKDSILQYRRKPVPLGDIPEWGGPVFVRVMSGTERDTYDAGTYRLENGTVQVNHAGSRARLLVRTLCDERGVRIFCDDDADLLTECDADLLDRCYARALEANGMGAKAVEEAVANFAKGTNASSGSTSPAT